MKCVYYKRHSTQYTPVFLQENMLALCWHSLDFLACCKRVLKTLVCALNTRECDLNTRWHVVGVL